MTDALDAHLAGDAVPDSALALHAVLAEVEKMGDDDVRAPSLLPGWTRGHVLAHVDGVGSAMARQAETAARGERAPVYDGGQEGRDRAIEEASTRTAAQHHDALAALAARLAGVWPPVGSVGWSAPVTFRDGTVVDVALAWWREARIHLVDLDVGTGPSSWNPALCRHLLDFLRPRLAAAGTVVLESDGVHERIGEGGATVTVSGRLTDLAAWLAGRTPETEVRATGAEGSPVALPDLGPWPSARR